MLTDGFFIFDEIQLIGGPLSALVSIIFLDAFDWIGVFWSAAAFSAVGNMIQILKARCGSLTFQLDKAGVITFFLPCERSVMR